MFFAWKVSCEPSPLGIVPETEPTIPEDSIASFISVRRYFKAVILAPKFVP
jgi:hypothetical protein